MKAGSVATAVLVLATVLGTSAAHASKSELARCQGAYPMLLMTPLECRTYLKQLRSAQARADHMAVLDLQEWHTELLIERSQACPCQTEPAHPIRVRRVNGHLTYLDQH